MSKWWNPYSWLQEAKDDEITEAERDFNTSLASVAFQEGIDPADLALAMEDKGWTRLGATQAGGGVPWATRKNTIIRARLYWQLDPMAAAAVRTWTNYTLGSGMTIKAADASVQSRIDAFFKNPKNRTMVSAEGQRKHNRRLLVDGEVFFGFYDTPDELQVRKIDSLEVTQLIKDPDDAEVVWAYRRERKLPNGKAEVSYYRSWAYPDQELSTAWSQDSGSQWVQGAVVAEEGCLVLHLAFDPFHDRGNSLFTSTLSWMTHMRQFMEDRISITKGLAKYISKLTFKGGKNQATKMATAVQAMSRPGQSPAIPGATPSMPLAPGIARETAKTFLSNDQVDFSTMPRLTGASDAKEDHKLIRLQIGCGVGMTEPYFMDAESGNLASATAMELPMLKQFESHQQLWADFWSDACAIIANFAKPEAVEVDVDYPPIVSKDISLAITALTNFVAEFPEAKQPELIKMGMTILGLNNVDAIMERVLKTARELQDKADNIAKGLGPDGSPLAPPPQPVVLPAKPAREQTVPGSQKVATVKEATELLADALIAEAAELEEAAKPEED